MAPDIWYIIRPVGSAEAVLKLKDENLVMIDNNR